MAAIMIHDDLIGPDGMTYAGKPILELPAELRQAVQQRHMQLMVATGQASAKGEAKAAGGPAGEAKPSTPTGVKEGYGKGKHGEGLPGRQEFPRYRNEGWNTVASRQVTVPYAQTRPGDVKRAPPAPPGADEPTPRGEAKGESGVIPQPRPRIRLQGRPDLVQPVPAVTPPAGTPPAGGYIHPQAIANMALAHFGTADPNVLTAARQQGLGDYANWFKTQDLSGVAMPQAGPQVEIPRGSQGPLPGELYQQGLDKFGGKELTAQDLDNRVAELTQEHKKEQARREQGLAGGPLQQALGGAFRQALPRAPQAPAEPAGPPAPKPRRRPAEHAPTGGYRIGPEHKLKKDETVASKEE